MSAKHAKHIILCPQGENRRRSTFSDRQTLHVVSSLLLDGPAPPFTRAALAVVARNDGPRLVLRPRSPIVPRREREECGGEACWRAGGDGAGRSVVSELLCVGDDGVSGGGGGGGSVGA